MQDTETADEGTAGRCRRPESVSEPHRAKRPPAGGTNRQTLGAAFNRIELPLAGFVNTKTKLAETQAELAKVKARLSDAERELARYRAANAPKRQRIISRQYDDSVIDELISWSEEGLFLDECLAQWGIDQPTWEKWLTDYVPLREAVGPARARARAAMLRTLREALKTRTAFPVSLADRIIAMVERENGTQDESADKLVRIDLCPRCATADAASAVATGQALDLAGPDATPERSHGAE